LPAFTERQSARTILLSSLCPEASLPFQSRWAKRSGANLFHSFERFSVSAGDTALFTSGATNLKNVITRVTGGQASTIQGTLSLKPGDASRPDFYFINPAGVVVQAGAHIDVPLVYTSALRARSSSRTALSSGPERPQRSLTTASPQAFGLSERTLRHR
jgi:filamentous hemagglutinin family protein